MGDPVTTINIDDLEVEQGKTFRKTQMGDTSVMVWASIEKGVLTYKCSTRRGDIVEHLRLPHDILHLDRAFEHAVQEVIDRAALRIADDEAGGRHVDPVVLDWTNYQPQSIS